MATANYVVMLTSESYDTDIRAPTFSSSKFTTAFKFQNINGKESRSGEPINWFVAGY